MNKLIIYPNQIPVGEIQVSGAKNSATRLMCAALLADKPCKISNFPTELLDARNKAMFFNNINVMTYWNEKQDELIIDAQNMSYPQNNNADFFNIPVRTTYLLAAAQIKRFGKAKIPYPGGCKLGERKYDLHVMVWEKFGCIVEEKNNFISIESKNGKLNAADILFPITTIGGTENALLCASIVKDKTIIRNAYISPEITDLIGMLKAMGVSINLIGSSIIEVIGSDNLLGVSYSVIPDRIEALTWLIYGALSKGTVLIKDVPFRDMEIPLIHVHQAEINFFRNTTDIYINPQCVDKYGVQPFELACGTHPGIISDMQPFYVLLALAAKGRSLVIDYRYPDRNAYLEELNKFVSMQISYVSGKIEIKGQAFFNPANARSTDLRGSMAVIMAALLAKGQENSQIENPNLALRGYNKLLEKLTLLGIKFQFIK